MSSAPHRRQVTIRRAPKIIPFLVLGALLALTAAAIITFTGPDDGQFSRGTVLGFFSALLLIPGLLLGAIAALVTDWISVRRTRQAVAEDVEPDEAEDDEQQSAEHPAEPHAEAADVADNDHDDRDDDAAGDTPGDEDDDAGRHQ